MYLEKWREKSKDDINITSAGSVSDIQVILSAFKNLSIVYL
jgi:hypothetical protein